MQEYQQIIDSKLDSAKFLDYLGFPKLTKKKSSPKRYIYQFLFENDCNRSKFQITLYHSFAKTGTAFKLILGLTQKKKEYLPYRAITLIKSKLMILRFGC